MLEWSNNFLLFDFVITSEFVVWHEVTGDGIERPYYMPVGMGMMNIKYDGLGMDTFMEIRRLKN